jgi:hypothetical protein
MVRSRHSINSTRERRRRAASLARLASIVSREMGPDLPSVEGRGPEARTTASSGLSCATCGRRLTGRKQRFCSDRCRMQARRAASAARLTHLLTTIERATTELRTAMHTQTRRR